MTDETIPQLFDRLDQLLDRERAALLVGDLDEVAKIGALKEAVIDALNAQESNDQPALIALQTKVEHNQVLLSGALEGIRAVATRLAALRQVRRSLQTYQASGERQTIEGEVVRKVEKRA